MQAAEKGDGGGPEPNNQNQATLVLRVRRAGVNHKGSRERSHSARGAGTYAKKKEGRDDETQVVSNA